MYIYSVCVYVYVSMRPTIDACAGKGCISTCSVCLCVYTEYVYTVYVCLYVSMRPTIDACAGKGVCTCIYIVCVYIV